ncbi:MAG: outer membrane beta-barrel protein [Psychroflexus sp.]
MKSSKSIERLFQEGLKDFQASPSHKVWDGIEEKLSGKKKRRRYVPFWLQVASVAAVLLIFSSIGAFYFHSFETKSQVSSKENSKIRKTPNSLEVIPAQYRFSSINNNLSTFENSIENSFAFQILETKTVNQTTSLRQAPDSFINNKLAERSFLTVNQLKSSEINHISNSLMASTLLENESKDNLFFYDNTEEKESLFDILEVHNVLAVEDDESIDKPWEVKPNVAPVFMNSLNGGNPIEPSLQGKTASSPNVSYGVNVAYSINKKIKIRTGVNQVAMGYNTQDVILTTTLTPFAANNSSYIKNNFIGEVSLISAVNDRTPISESTNSLRVQAMEYSPVGSINHELGFLEVPLEVEYSIINKKLGIHLLGGASTFLLNNNEIFFEENGRSSSIGEAENLNNLSFSANFGLGMDYNFSETLSFNLEPKFMYQINTFQNTNSSFQPYFFGIYSGIKIKF